jgi:hypothetical protein
MNSKKCCIYCSKQYIREKSLVKHQIICEILFNKKKYIPKSEEDEPIYTLKQLNIIVNELVLKNAKLEEDIKELKKYVIKEKKKFNVIEWLATNVITMYPFEEFIDKLIIKEKHIEYMRFNKLLDTIYLIIDDHVEEECMKLKEPCHEKKEEDIKYKKIPIICISEKRNAIYIYMELSKNWLEFTHHELIILLNKIHKKILIKLCEWKRINIEKIRTDDKYSEIYNKLMLKLMDIDFKKECVLTNVRTTLYNKLKIDVKNILEYEF